MTEKMNIENIEKTIYKVLDNPGALISHVGVGGL